jgi:hypothetical protein
MDNASAIGDGNETKQDEGQPPQIMKERTSGRNRGWKKAAISAPANTALGQPENINRARPNWFQFVASFPLT